MSSYDFENSLGYKIELCSRLMSNKLNQKFKQQGYPVTAEQWAIINYLLVEDGLSQKRLSQLVKKDHTSVSRLLNNLIKNGVVKRVTDQSDRRTNLIYLTTLGRQLQSNLTEQLQKHLENAVEGIDPNEIKMLSITLDNIIENLKTI